MDSIRILVFVAVCLTVVAGWSPHVNTIPPGDHFIEDRFIVRLSNRSDELREQFTEAIERLSFRLQEFASLGKLRFAIINGSSHLVERLKGVLGVLSVEQDRMSFAFGGANTTEPPFRCVTQKTRGVWGLDRVDQVESHNWEYTHSETSNGAGVNAYVVDTGINVDDSQFEGRATWGFQDPWISEDEEDKNGHGTHCAGTIGAAKYGVAKKVNLIAVKVLDRTGSGTASGFLAGLEWVIDHYNKNGKPKSVINLSLGFAEIVPSLDEAVQEAVDAGITVVVAAGNDDVDACLSTPAHVSSAITVGASTMGDTGASFSNWGTCLDIWAPGQAILSIDHRGPDLKSGTSMAAPHVTGAIARYMSSLPESPTPTESAQWVIGASVKDTLEFITSEHQTSPNRLLHMPCMDDYNSLQMSANSASTFVPTFVVITAFISLVFA